MEIYSKIEPYKLLHVINRLSEIKGRTEIIPKDNFIQCATLKMEKNKIPLKTKRIFVVLVGLEPTTP